MTVNIALYSKNNLLADGISTILKDNHFIKVDTIKLLEETLEQNNVNIAICDLSISEQKDFENISEKFSEVDFIIIANNKDPLKLVNSSYEKLYKPIHINNLLQLIKTLISQRNIPHSSIIIGDYEFNFLGKSAKNRNHVQINLTEKEISLIKFLFEKNTLVKREELLHNIWGYSNDADTHTVQTHIYRLRRKLGDDFIITTDQGYKLNLHSS